MQYTIRRWIWESLFYFWITLEALNWMLEIYSIHLKQAPARIWHKWALKIKRDALFSLWVPAHIFPAAIVPFIILICVKNFKLESSGSPRLQDKLSTFRIASLSDCAFSRSPRLCLSKWSRRLITSGGENNLGNSLFLAALALFWGRRGWRARACWKHKHCRHQQLHRLRMPILQTLPSWGISYIYASVFNLFL